MENDRNSDFESSKNVSSVQLVDKQTSDEAEAQKYFFSQSSDQTPGEFGFFGRDPLGSCRTSLQVILNYFQMTQTEQTELVAIIENCIVRSIKQKDSARFSRWGLQYLPTLPTTSLTGPSSAMDFGCSSHFIRIVQYNFTEGQKDKPHEEQAHEEQRTFLLPPTVRRLEMSKFCDFVAGCVKQTLPVGQGKPRGQGGPVLFMGISAGFDLWVKPQKCPTSAIVRVCDKEYKMTGFIGGDIVEHFQAAFGRAELNIKIAAVMNDAVAVLLAGIHHVSLKPEPEPPDCSIGLVCHKEGFNISYLESDLEFAEMLRGEENLLLPRPRGAGRCAVVNTEAGYCIGAGGELDCWANPILSHVHRRLKVPMRLQGMASGVWYQKILHRALELMLATEAVSFQLKRESTFNGSVCFDIFTLCERCSDRRTGHKFASQLAPLLGVKQVSQEDAVAVSEVCGAVVNYTADVLATVVWAIAQRTYGRQLPKRILIAYSGSLFASLSNLKTMFETSLRCLVPDSTEVSIAKLDMALGVAVTALSAGQMPS